MQSVEQTVTIELSEKVIEKLFDDEFDGWCPICKAGKINDGEVICCSCFRQALAFHINTCGCYPP